MRVVEVAGEAVGRDVEVVDGEDPGAGHDLVADVCEPCGLERLHRVAAERRDRIVHRDGTQEEERPHHGRELRLRKHALVDRDVLRPDGVRVLSEQVDDTRLGVADAPQRVPDGRRCVLGRARVRCHRREIMPIP